MGNHETGNTKGNENPVHHPVFVCHPEFISGSHMMLDQEILKRVQNDRLEGILG